MIPSLVWGERRGEGGAFRVHSPLDDSLLAEGELLGGLDPLAASDLPTELDLESACAGLTASLHSRRREFVDALRRETGFVPGDCEELVEAALAYAGDYASHPSTALPSRTDEIRSVRRMRLIDVPIGTVAAILPHNAFLPLALSCGLNAVRAGNRAILRAPQQSALSASLLAEALEETPELSRWLSVAVCPARPFVDWFLQAPVPGLLHFFGSSHSAADLVSRGFGAGKPVLIDGEGNVWVYVDRDFSPERAAEILVAGALRYNGQTCTSINGAIVHPDVYERVLELVVERVRAIGFGNGEGDAVGPVFDETQAEWCVSQAAQSGGRVALGGRSEGPLVSPTLVVQPSETSALVREGVFGPVFWMSSGDADAFAMRWGSNRYPLCAGVLQESADPHAWAARLPNLARLVINGDPSVEDPFEYWGGYPPSGQNAVSAWPAKYRRTLQIDTP